MKFLQIKMKTKYFIPTILAFCISFQLSFAQTGTYVIRKGDVLDIAVMEHPEFSIAGIIVLPDGTIQYPGFGSIVAAEMTTKNLRDTLETSLEKYVVNPLVTVFIRQIRNQNINVFGYVNNPGQYQLFEGMDLVSALSLAGGIKNVKKVKKSSSSAPTLPSKNSLLKTSSAKKYQKIPSPLFTPEAG